MSGWMATTSFKAHIALNYVSASPLYTPLRCAVLHCIVQSFAGRSSHGMRCHQYPAGTLHANVLRSLKRTARYLASFGCNFSSVSFRFVFEISIGLSHFVVPQHLAVFTHRQSPTTHSSRPQKSTHPPPSRHTPHISLCRCTDINTVHCFADLVVSYILQVFGDQEVPRDMMHMCKAVFVGILGFAAMASAAESKPLLRGAGHVGHQSFEEELKKVVNEGADARGVDAEELWSKIVWPSGVNPKKLSEIFNEKTQVLCDGCDETFDFEDDDTSFSFNYDG